MEPFDPYSKWLGIPPAEQPPNHYRLLGLKPLEANPEVIARGADRVAVHLQKFSTGQFAAPSQKLLQEVAAAKQCLLQPAAKAAYDAKLRQRLGLAAPQELPSLAASDPFGLGLPPLDGGGLPSLGGGSPSLDAGLPSLPSLDAGGLPPLGSLPTSPPQAKGKAPGAAAGNPPAEGIPIFFVVGGAVGVFVLLLLVAVFALSGGKPAPIADRKEPERIESPPPAAAAPAPEPTPAATEPAPAPTAPPAEPPAAPPPEQPAPPPVPETLPKPAEPPKPLPVMEPTPEAQVVERVDLLARVNGDRDSARPDSWRREGPELVSGVSGAYLNVPYVLPLDLRLRLEIRVEPPEGKSFLAAAIPAGLDRNQVPVLLNAPGAGGVHSGVDQVDGKRFFENDTTKPGAPLPEGNWFEVVYTVRPGLVEAVVAGVPVVVWNRSVSSLGGVVRAEHRQAPLLRPDCLVLWVGPGKWRVRKLALEHLKPLPGFPMPAAEALSAARKGAAEILEPRVKAAKDPASRPGAVKELLRTARDMDAGSAERYALLERVRTWAVDVGATETALAAADELSLYEGPDPLARRVQTLKEGAGKVQKGSHLVGVDKAIGALSLAAAADRLDEAEAMLQAAKDSARKGTPPLHQKELFEIWTERLRRLNAAADELVEARAKPNDPASVLALGKHRLIDCEDFDRGLPLLAKSDDPLWKDLAAADLANPSDVDGEYELAEKWRKAAESLTATDRAAARHRAGEWYRATLPKLDSARKKKAFEALDEVGVDNLRRDVRDRTASHRGKRFLCIVDGLPWQQAEMWAREQGGRLACIRDGAENSHVAKLAAEPLPDDEVGNAWIGATDDAAEGVWTWVDGSRFAYKNWASKEPNNLGDAENGAHLYLDSKPEKHGKWNDLRMGAHYWYVVQWPIPSSP